MLWKIMSVAMVVCTVVAGVYYYILINRILSLFVKQIKIPWKIVIALLALILGLLSGDLFSTIGVILVHIAAAALVMEVVNLIVKRAGKQSEKPKWNRIYKSCLIPVLITAVIFTYGYFNIRHVVEKEYTVETEKNIRQDYRVLLVTDSHYGTIFETETLKKLKTRMDAVEADIALLGGDIVDESTTKDEMQEIFRTFGQIKAKYGVYYIYGNHDRQRYASSSYYTPQELEDTIRQSGITVLEDNYVSIAPGLVLAGREDASPARKSVTDILQGVKPEDYIIMADHQPIEYAENKKAGVDLILSGHTHAGQIFPSGYVMKFFHTFDLWYGHTTVDSMDAVVSAGLAGWGYPIRTQKHSEYTIINIKRKEREYYD
ncbi:MAG: metallophosphoesterase [Lachnospiraceae bacterium]|nr:metallophosphoesterase [Lachnospiraceae bacterium]